MINEKNLNLAGWASVIAAVLIIPITIIAFFLRFSEGLGFSEEIDPSLKYLYTILNVCTYGLNIYLLITLKRLLNNFANFYNTDKYITFFIFMSIVFAGSELISILLPSLEDIMITIFITLLIPAGVIYIVFGVKLLNCNNNLFGYLKPLSYLIIAGGVLTASVILVLFAVLTSVIYYIILSIIFFKVAKEYGNLSMEDQTQV